MQTINLTFDPQTRVLSADGRMAGVTIDHRAVELTMDPIPGATVDVVYGVLIRERDGHRYYPFTRMRDGRCVIPPQVLVEATRELPIHLRITYDNRTVEGSKPLKLDVAYVPGELIDDSYGDLVLMRGDAWTWIPEWTYSEDAFVVWNDNMWISTIMANLGHEPGTDEAWRVIAPQFITDEVPMEGSRNLVYSGGVWSELQGKADAGSIQDLRTDLETETGLREQGDIRLQEQVDAIEARADVVDIVGTKAQLDIYDTSRLTPQDIIKVLSDESQQGASTYYRWTGSVWVYVGRDGEYYTKAEADGLLDAKLDRTGGVTVYSADPDARQVRNIIRSDRPPSDADGEDGDLWAVFGEEPSDFATRTELETKLDKSGGTLTGPVTVAPGDGQGIILPVGGNINDSNLRTLFGFFGGQVLVNHPDYDLVLRGSQAVPQYNGEPLAMDADVMHRDREETVTGPKAFLGGLTTPDVSAEDLRRGDAVAPSRQILDDVQARLDGKADDGAVLHTTGGVLTEYLPDVEAAQVRNIIRAERPPEDSEGMDGDVWIQEEIL